MRRITNFNHLVALVAVFATIMMVSCFKDDVVSTPALRVESETICFSTDVEWADEDEITRGGGVRNRVGMVKLASADGANTLPMGIYEQEGIHIGAPTDTRGSKIESDDISSFKVWASLTGVNDTSLLFPAEGVEFNKNSNNIFESDPQYFWPGAGSIDFVAVANAPASGFTPNLNSADTAVESFTYTVPTTATEQNDIVVAAPDEPVSGSYNKSVPLNFEHVMSAVNFRVGSQMANGKIKSITLNNVYSQGTYNIANGTWGTPAGDSKKSFAVNFSETTSDGMYEPNGKEGTDIDINGGEYTFMMLPQVLPDDAELVVEFLYDNLGGAVTTLRTNIAKKVVEGEVNAGNYEWKKNKTIYYTISIDENYNLTITPNGDILDAHYVMTDITINVDTPNDADWTLEVSATNIDGDDVSVQFVDNLNPIIANEGYWIDKDDSNVSLRGGKSITGTKTDENKEFKVRVFIPENVTAQERKIMLKLYLNNEPDNAKYEYLYQKYPYWDEAKGFGWERVENTEEGQFGFNWDRVVCYAYKYTLSIASLGGWAEHNASYDVFNNIVSTLTTKYNAQDYVTIKYFKYDNGIRGCVIIDYTKIPAKDYFAFYNMSEGLVNTQAFITGLNNANVFAFENALASVMKTESGQTDVPAFRIPLDEGANDNNRTLGKWEAGGLFGRPTFSEQAYTDGKGRIHSTTFNDATTMDDMSGILKYVIQRNNFNAKRISINEGYYYDVNLDPAHIKWYLPAVNQYANPVLSFATGNTTFTPANFWSSTACEDDNTSAYLGSGTPELRTEKKKVVVQRIVKPIPQPTTISDISTEEMAGGENGEAQWVN